ncbi:MAG: tetratricopeptide repeat protein [Cyclobacteriaceae bacterium]
MNLLKTILAYVLILAFAFSCGESSSSEGDTYYNNEQYEEAIIAYAKYLENKPKNFKALYNKGRAHEELSEFKKAEESFKAALKLDPKNIQVLLSLSNLKQKQKDPGLALMYADNAVEISGAPALAYFMKARSMHLLGNVEEAMREYNVALKMNPKFGQAYYYRGMLNAATDKTTQACADFRKAEANGYEDANDAVEKYCP